MSNLDGYAISVLTGSKRTSRSHFKPVRAHLQGTEITSIHGYRSVLPIVGRNQRYSIIDTHLTASVSDKNYFTDVESCSDAGLGQDTYETFYGTRFNFAATTEHSVPSEPTTRLHKFKTSESKNASKL